ncbi:MAG: AAA family ATPase [Erysipelotrichaceae bacterium]|nr:AAA family ATPase [Erysipelotrichaceae bacterium]
MKTSELLKQSQPVVYSTLHNALKNSHLSHCYLFVGDKGTMKRETALLMAQSLICSEPKEDVWACEECIDCIRIAENNYFDLILIDGSDGPIKIEEINRMQQQFDKTALEAAGVKVLIIDHAENLTGKSANSLLKMIEEPQGDLTIIFITERIERILPTIVSRCQVINFRPQSKKALEARALQLGLDPLDAHIACQLIQSEEQIADLDSDAVYHKAISYFIEFANRLFDSYYDCIYYTQSTGFKTGDTAAEKKSSRNCFSLVLSIASIFVHDYLSGTSVDDESWTSLLEKARSKNFNATAFLKCISNSQDCLLYASNQALVIDQLLYALKEVI